MVENAVVDRPCPTREGPGGAGGARGERVVEQDGRGARDGDRAACGPRVAVLVRRGQRDGVSPGRRICVARGCTGAGAAVAEVPGVGKARGLNGRADIRRGGREAQGGPGSSRAGPGQARRRRHVIDRDHDRAAAGQLMGVGHGERRRIAARIGIRVRRVQRARLVRPVAKVPGVGEGSGAASLSRLAECQGRLGVDRQGGTRIDYGGAEDRDRPAAGADLAVLVRRRH